MRKEKKRRKISVTEAGKGEHIGNGSKETGDIKGEKCKLVN